jgi:REP element-mobilizing transposase RayT
MGAKQLSLLPKSRSEHGGDVRRGRRKLDRPFSPRSSIHVVMRAPRARGQWSMLHRHNRATVDRLVYTWASAKGVRIYQYVNVGNHLHFLLRAESREALQRFLKTFAGLAARSVTGARKGVSVGRFWERTAYSRLVPGGAFKAVSAYLGKNHLEAIGFRGARLRIRANGSAIVVVVGEAPTELRAQAERAIRGDPGG